MSRLNSYIDRTEARVSEAIRRPATLRIGVGRAEPAREILREPLAVCGAVGPVPDRLQQIARLYVLGLSTTDIGRVLYLSPNTVKSYMTHITDLCGLSMHDLRKRVLSELAVTVGAADA